MRDGDELQKAFQIPVGHSQSGYLLVWRPGTSPTNLYRRTSAFAKLMALWAGVTIASLMVLGCFIEGLLLLTTSLPKAVGWLVIAVLLGSMFYIWIAESGLSVVERIGDSWLRSVPDTELYRPRSALEVNLVKSLETIQHSRAVATGIVTNERLTELHKHVWALLNSQGVTEGDVGALQQAATEITKIDHMLVQRESKTSYDHAREAGKALQDQGQAIAEELRLLRKFLDNEGNE